MARKLADTATELLFDLPASRQERDVAIQQVAENNSDFMRRGLTIISQLWPGEYTGEEIRGMLTHFGLAPRHPNVWGALINAAVKRGLLHDTGKTQPMRDVKSHARRTPVYRVKEK